MKKRFSKKIMKMSCLKNEFLNTKSDINRKAYNKQRSGIFWVTIKPFLHQKVTKDCNVNLVKGKKVISREDTFARKFVEYFINIPILNM